MCATVAFGDEIDEVFDSLYAQQIKTVKATPSRKDDVSLAGEMLSLIEKTNDTPALLARIAEEAY